MTCTCGHDDKQHGPFGCNGGFPTSHCPCTVRPHGDSAVLEEWGWLHLAESTLAEEWGRPEDDVYNASGQIAD